MKHILVTGANGQLGSAIKVISTRFDRFTYSFVDIQDLDLTNESQTVSFFRHNRFDYIINCAAFTAVDQAEEQHEHAYKVNAGIPKLLGRICLGNKVYLIHLSTDYVYDGKLSLPHHEDEQVVAESVYAQSKLQGEISLWNNPNAMIIRTSWLYSEYGNNFLRNMLRIADEKNELSVVFDQTGSPTYAGDLAESLLKIIEFSESSGFKSGIFNFSNEGVCSWYDFAVEIMGLAGRSCRVKPIRTSEYPLPAKRPEYSVMDKSKIKNTFGLVIPHWKQSLSVAIRNIQKNQEIISGH